MMRVRSAVVGCCVALLSAADMAAGPADAAAPKALAFIDGTWQGGGHAIILDTERLQANLSPQKPFQWTPLIIRNITDQMVTFSIGEQRFIGLFDGDQLALTGDGLNGTIQLLRSRKKD